MVGLGAERERQRCHRRGGARRRARQAPRRCDQGIGARSHAPGCCGPAHRRVTRIDRSTWRVRRGITVGCVVPGSSPCDLVQFVHGVDLAQHDPIRTARASITAISPPEPAEHCKFADRSRRSAAANVMSRDQGCVATPRWPRGGWGRASGKRHTSACQPSRQSDEHVACTATQHQSARRCVRNEVQCTTNARRAGGGGGGGECSLQRAFRCSLMDNQPTTPPIPERRACQPHRILDDSVFTTVSNATNLRFLLCPRPSANRRHRHRPFSTCPDTPTRHPLLRGGQRCTSCANH